MPRARLSLIVVKEGSLPFSYQHILMGFVYAMISREDPSLVEMVHSTKSSKLQSNLRGMETPEDGIIPRCRFSLRIS